MGQEETLEHLTLDTFKKKIFNWDESKDWKYKGDLPCIIDFYADWCGPCKMVAPVLEEIAKDYEGKVNIFKIDTEEQQELAGVFGISSIPTIMFCPMDGQPQAAAGALPKSAIESAINDVLLKPAETEAE